MLNIGVLNKTSGTGTRKYEGVVHLGRRLNGWLYLDENPRYDEHMRSRREDDNAPAPPIYTVRYLPTGWRGSEMKIGACWHMTSERTGTDYFSMQLADPDWPAPHRLYLSAFATEDGKGNLDVVWSPPQPKGAQQAEAIAA